MEGDEFQWIQGEKAGGELAVDHFLKRMTGLSCGYDDLFQRNDRR